MKQEKTIYKVGLDIGSTTAKTVLLKNNDIVYSKYIRHNAKIYETITPFFRDIKNQFGNIELSISVTGSAGMGVTEKTGFNFVQEVIAETEFIKKFYPQTRVLIDMGGEDSKMIFFDKDKAPDIRMNGSCAGGTGAFIDQMVSLMDITPVELNELAKNAKQIFPVASRCGVFAKTDVQNLLSRNISKEDIALSIFNAVSIQVVNTLARGIEIEPKVMFVGGPFTFFSELTKIFVKNLKLTDNDIEKIDTPEFIPAFGSAISESEKKNIFSIDEVLEKLETAKNTKIVAKNRLNPLFSSKEEFEEWEKQRFSPLVKKVSFDDYKEKEFFIGIDSGSTTTKIIAMGKNREVLFRFYENNAGDPVKTVAKGLKQLRETIKNKDVTLAQVGVTGYGEDLIKAAFDADEGVVETIAHFTAAHFLNDKVSFILDIGGQDMKAIFIENGIVKKLELNESCSSGCGSFIETFSKNLGYGVADFAKIACNSPAPSDLGTRCTVFMNSKVKQSLRENASVDDISAGLAISVIKNALYKVLKLKNSDELGNHIVVQGGTFKNPAIHRALEVLTGKKAVCSTIPEMMGAYGAAIFAQKKYEKTKKLTKFTGLLENNQEKNFTKKQIVCHGCPNVCNVTKFVFENGNIFFSGNKCEKIFSNKGSVSQKGFNFSTFKEELLFNRESKKDAVLKIGIPRGLNLYENYPFWHTLFTEMNIEVVLSDNSTMSIYKKGLGTVMSDNICFPAKLVHGHIFNLIEKGVDRIFYPKVFFEKNTFKDAENAFNCPVVSGYPDVIQNSIEPEGKYKIPFDSPTINFNNEKLLKKACKQYFQEINLKGNFEKAFKKALKEQESYVLNIQKKATELINKAKETNSILFVVAGRPYHSDPLINQKTFETITAYGADTITEDSVLPSKNHKFSELQVISQWTYPNRIYNAALWVTKQKDNIQFIQLNSFGCGPDAITIDEANEILNTSGKNNTVIRIDEITSTGSINLRVRSLIESLKLRTNEQDYKKPRITTKTFEKSDKRKTIIAPFFAPNYSPLIPSLFKLMGYNMEILPEPDRKSVEIGLKYANNEICYPATIVIGDIIKALQSGKYNLDEIAVGITQTGGQCRASTYLSLIKKGMIASGFKDIPVISVGTAGKTINPQPGFKPNYIKALPSIFEGMMFLDSVSKLYYSTVAREKIKGSTKKVFDKYVKLAQKYIETKKHKEMNNLLEEAVRDFNNIDTDFAPIPKIGFVGEIYVKFNPFANGHTVQWLIDQGVEVVMPPLFEFFAQEFINIDVNKKLNLRKAYFSDFFVSYLNNQTNKKLKRTNEILSKFKHYQPYHCLKNLSKKAEKIISLANQFGEGWLIPAEVSEFAENGINNTISVQPFGCIANHIISKGIEKRVKQLYPKMNFLFLDFDADTTEVNVLNRLHFMVKNAKESILKTEEFAEQTQNTTNSKELLRN